MAEVDDRELKLLRAVARSATRLDTIRRQREPGTVPTEEWSDRMRRAELVLGQHVTTLSRYKTRVSASAALANFAATYGATVSRVRRMMRQPGAIEGIEMVGTQP